MYKMAAKFTVNFDASRREIDPTLPYDTNVRQLVNAMDLQVT
jgi:hypothetical protein